MSDNMSGLVTLSTPHSPDPIDLRRVGAHPDYWYPVAWGDELKVGKTLARRFAGEPIGADWNNEVFPPLRDLRAVLGTLPCANERF